MTDAAIPKAAAQGYRALKVYQLAYTLAMEIFKESRAFPQDERYSLTAKSAVPRGVWQGILRKAIASASIRTCSSASWLTPMLKQPKPRCGSISPAIVLTFRLNTITSW